jgi:hypothetical protein
MFDFSRVALGFDTCRKIKPDMNLYVKEMACMIYFRTGIISLITEDYFRDRRLDLCPREEEIHMKTHDRSRRAQSML